MGLSVRGIHADPEIPYPRGGQRFDESLRFFRYGGLSPAGEHIAVGATTQIGNSPTSGMMQKIDGFLKVKKGFASGQGHRVDSVFLTLIQNIPDPPSLKFPAFYPRGLSHAALGAGCVTVVGYLNNQLPRKFPEDDGKQIHYIMKLKHHDRYSP
jgi:hypothetical protein